MQHSWRTSIRYSSPYKLHKLTGLEYLTLQLLYANRNTEVGRYLLSDLYGTYARYVKIHNDHGYISPTENTLKSLKSKLSWLAPRLSLLNEFHIQGEHSNRATLFVHPDSFEDRVIRYILYCHTPPNDFWYCILSLTNFKITHATNIKYSQVYACIIAYMHVELTIVYFSFSLIFNKYAKHVMMSASIYIEPGTCAGNFGPYYVNCKQSCMH